ncbi:MAG: rRNA maturation RNase YbeY [Caldilineaceae bacterium]|nr:rRNA maturation RNase YbeY [Caldilineaceae bacterium]
MTYSIHIEIDDTFIEAVDPASLQLAAELTLAACGESAGLLSLVITDDATVQELNRTYRGIDSPTDVLSFANQDPTPMPSYLPPIGDADEERAADTVAATEMAWTTVAEDESGADESQLPDELAAELATYLGDILIAYPYAARQAADYENSVAAELRLLTVHGVLHLLGYDHASAEEEAEMWSIQRQVLAHFGDEALTYRAYQVDESHG